MKQISFKVMTAITAVLVLTMVFYSCKKDENKSNPFEGRWIMDSNSDMSIELTDSRWVVKNVDDIYCSGTYTYIEKVAALVVTNEGVGNVTVGDFGTAIISGNTLIMSGFKAGELNHTFTKEEGSGGGGDDPDDPGDDDDDVYQEPYLQFGVSMETVKEFEIRELEGESSDEDYDYLIYFGENEDVMGVYYIFASDELIYDVVALYNTSNIETRVFDFLSRKHEYLGEDEDGYYFKSSDETAYIVFYYDENEDGWFVQYAPVGEKSSLPVKSLSRSIQNKFIEKQ